MRSMAKPRDPLRYDQGMAIDYARALQLELKRSGDAGHCRAVSPGVTFLLSVLSSRDCLIRADQDAHVLSYRRSGARQDCRGAIARLAVGDLRAAARLLPGARVFARPGFIREM